jgi:hypothetical protein
MPYIETVKSEDGVPLIRRDAECTISQPGRKHEFSKEIETTPQSCHSSGLENCDIGLIRIGP